MTHYTETDQNNDYAADIICLGNVAQTTKWFWFTEIQIRLLNILEKTTESI